MPRRGVRPRRSPSLRSGPRPGVPGSTIWRRSAFRYSRAERQVFAPHGEYGYRQPPLFNQPVECGVTGKAKDVIDAVVLTPTHGFVAPDGDLRLKPVLTDVFDLAPQPSADLRAKRRFAGAQDHGGRTASAGVVLACNGWIGNAEWGSVRHGGCGSGEKCATDGFDTHFLRCFSSLTLHPPAKSTRRVNKNS